MKCPKCNTTENIKWVLRHQKIDENDQSNAANVITLLCADCGFNQSVFIQEYLEDIFIDWTNNEKTGPSVVPFKI